MNELIILFHILIVVGFAFGALRLGKEALVAWAAVQAILANLFVLKQIDLLGFIVTCSDVFAIGSILALNLLQEYYGPESAKKTAWISFYAMIFFGVMSQIHLLYVPSQADFAHSSFQTILGPAPRLLLASLAAFFIVQQIDIRVFGFLKKKLTHAPLYLRNGISLILSQLIDTALFSVLGLYGIAESLSDIILVSFALKVIIIFCLTPFIAASKRWAVRNEI